MKLSEYFLSEPRGTYAAMAEAMKVSKSYLSQMVTGKTNISAERSVEIERLTHGAVTRADLRPHDYWLIWPDLPAPTTPNDSLGEAHE